MRGKTIPAIAMLALLIVAFTVSAVAACECVNLIEDVRAALASTYISSKNADFVRACLDAKLTTAIDSHEAGNYKHAVKQLEIFKARVEMQSAKIADADNLIKLANDAITSIEDSH